MALCGTIKDFGLGDIFQLIGIQRKTGTLKLDDGRDVVIVKFLEGQIVGADTRSRSVEDLLGAVLVRTGRITADNLKKALKIQKSTLQRLGFVLVKAKFITEEELVEALRVQSLQIVYRLFRWREGTYEFTACENVDYDEQHFEPISAESILMEGARMIDEWPIIERRITSGQLVLRQTEAAQSLKLDVQTIVESDDFDFDFDGAGEIAPRSTSSDDAGVKLSPEERALLIQIDGVRNVEALTDLSNLGEFDTHRILADLLTRNLVEPVVAPAEEASDRSALRAALGKAGELLLCISVLVVAGGSLALLQSNGTTPWGWASEDSATRYLRQYLSQVRLERIDRALQVFYLDAGTYPLDLGALTPGGYLRDEDLMDPWGRAYAYTLSGDGYLLYGTDAVGETAPQLRVSHLFTSSERSMTAGTLSSSDPP